MPGSPPPPAWEPVSPESEEGRNSLGALIVVAFIAASAFFLYRGRQRQAAGTPYLSVGGTPGGGGGGGAARGGDIEIGSMSRDWDTGWKDDDDDDDVWGDSPAPGREALSSPGISRAAAAGTAGGGSRRGTPGAVKASDGGWSDDDNW